MTHGSALIFPPVRRVMKCVCLASRGSAMLDLNCGWGASAVKIEFGLFDCYRASASHVHHNVERPDLRR